MATPPFLLGALAHLHQQHPQPRPHVTLTFAQSLDAKIAGHQGQQLILSGKQSMIMTHWMRTMHDGIMIGIGTALNDDPQLNTRHLPPSLNGQPHPLPRPIVLDPHLRLSPTCKLLTNFQAKSGRQPWVLCATPPEGDRIEWQRRYDTLSQAGASVINLDSTTNIIPIPVILEKLRSLGISSLMVEGGARVIESFLQANLSTPLVDSLIVTVAPTLVGSSGVAYGTTTSEGKQHLHNLRHTDTQVIGGDAIIIFKSVEA